MANTSTVSARPAIRTRSLATGLCSLDRCLLIGVALVTCLVSLPRFHDLMLSANERDARQALEWFSEALVASEGGGGTASLGVLAATPGMRHRLVDLRMAADGTSGSHHGYGLRIVHDAQGPIILAWPLSPGRSGRQAYALRPGEPLQQTDDLALVGFPPMALSSTMVPGTPL